jgi:diaminohydroxyphosphoribosylaminopyrimidine deaminase/5-amino-6-(5-phosphoribosylamino)uracil reductase
VLVAIGDSVDIKTKRAMENAGAELLEFPTTNGKININNLLKVLGEREVTSILLEAGGILLGSFFEAHMVDKVIAFIAPMVVGGESMVAVGGLGVEKIADAARLERVTVERFGDDLMIGGYIRK